MTFDTQDVATILAALRFYQASGMGDPAMRSDAIHDIATDGGKVTSMDAAGIDDLCDRINTPDLIQGAAPEMLAALKSAERMLKHYVGEPPESDPVDAARRPVLHAAWESIKRARTAISKAEGRANG